MKSAYLPTLIEPILSSSFINFAGFKETVLAVSINESGTRVESVLISLIPVAMEPAKQLLSSRSATPSSITTFVPLFFG